MRARWMVVAAFAGAAACGGNVVVDGTGGQTGSQGSGSGTPSVSCDINGTDPSGLHVCIELDNPTPAGVSNLTAMCVGVGATLGTTCSSANRLGTCTMTDGEFPAKDSFYSGGGLTAAQAQMACAGGGGTWTSG